MKLTLTPETLANMQPEDPDKIYTYSSYDIRGFEYTFKGTPAEYRADKEERRRMYRDSMRPSAQYVMQQCKGKISHSCDKCSPKYPCHCLGGINYVSIDVMRPTLIQRIKHWLNPNSLKGWKFTQETETYISSKVRDEKFW